MAYFPFYMDIEGEFCLIVGGGKTALRKAKVLIEYGACVKVVASEFCIFPTFRYSFATIAPLAA